MSDLDRISEPTYITARSQQEPDGVGIQVRKVVRGANILKGIVEWEQYDEGRIMGPSFVLSSKEAQILFDDLYRQGFRPQIIE